MGRRTFFSLLVIFLFIPELFAQDSLSRVFELGEVRILGNKTDISVLHLDEVDIRRIPGANTAAVLNRLPGVNLMQFGQKNEYMLSVRGFDLRQVPVLLDGVPVYLNYDGYADLGRFLTGGLSNITLSSNGASLLHGPNVMGGAINMVSRRPVNPLEIETAAGFMLDEQGFGGWQTDLAMGSRREKFYMQAELSFLDRNAYTTADGPVPNTQQKDLNASAKIAYTPNSGDSYVLSYYLQEGSKGVAAYKGSDPFERTRYWQFPAIRKQGIHLNTFTVLAPNSTLRTRWYADTYFSDLHAYDDSTLSSQHLRSSFTSVYKDVGLGASVIYSYQAKERHYIQLALHGIYDIHREGNIHPVQESERHFRDLSYSLALEDEYRITEKLSGRFGIGVQLKNNLQADDYAAGSDSVFPFPGHDDRAMNFLTGVQWKITDKQQLGMNLSRKSRFPTMKDRYSYRLGRSLPNPDLVAEHAWGADLEYDLRSGTVFHFSSALFYSHLDHAIQAVYGVDQDEPSIYQYRNTGEARFYGWEAEVVLRPFRGLEIGSQYSLVKRENLSQPEISFTGVPEHKLYSRISYSFVDERIFLHLGGLYNSERLRTSDGLYMSDPFYSIDFSMELSVKDFMFTLGVSNLLDASYAYMEGYVAPGRQVQMGIRYRFSQTKRE